jgi:hypothetical protein
VHQPSVLFSESVNQADGCRVRIVGKLGIERNLVQA